ncbi:MAG TPA: aldehyde dehydrogenase family protein [Thermodesulfovibrionales bacterium]|nr:aldehyde dehydrogenase family protein [Thermodesulfovibrionales bacterium]
MKSMFPILLGGRAKETDKKIEVLNPYDDRTVSRVCQATHEDVQEALAIADETGGTIGTLASHRKSAILRRVSDIIGERKEDLAKTITLENGKPIHESRTEVDRASLTFRIASEETSRIGGEFIALDRNPSSEGRWGITRRFPCGTVFGITPFNFPLNLVAHKIAPAIAAGNPIILKPASKTPITALLLGEILMESGLPEGCLSVIPCTGKIAENAITDKRVKVLSFTGSATVGWELKKLAYDKKVILELGGNAGVLLDRDCSLDLAVDRCIAGAFSYAGQVCISVQRIYVHRDIHDDFLGRFIPKVKTLKFGDPLDDSTLIGPMIDEENRVRVETWMHEAMAAGAKIAAGGKRWENFYEPTVVLDATPQMKLSCMEVFAPVVTVTRIESFEDGLKAVNDSVYGLQAGVFTNDLKHAFTAFETLEVGSVIINDVPAYRVDHMPYGGVKRSGFGREGIKYAIEEMTELRLMALHLV